ncbi:MAG TPA: IPT/TIG domain-containing protein [Terracidiphilus sp.]|nr:IPT/TIG domain-containing protein [Terracidiphilus sp.]
MRWIAPVLSLLCAPLFALAATAVVVNSGAINYSTNQVTLTGTGFQPAKAKPTLSFNGAALTTTTVSNTQIVATLPTGLTPGTFSLIVTNSQGNSADFDMTYGATGVQGPAGPAGPQGPAGATGATGPQGPRGITGAPGASGPAGANGIGFTFLNAYDPYATYTLNEVVAYQGSSYIAIVPNGPNPSGPTPNQNPSWSLLAAAGSAGPTGPQGLQGPQGLTGAQGSQGIMGNPGSIGPAGPTGPQGPTGGVLSYAANTFTNPGCIFACDIQLTSGTFQNVLSITLANVGTYILNGQVSLENGDASHAAAVECTAFDSSGVSQNSTSVSYGIANASNDLNLPVGGSYVAQTAPVTLNLECEYGGDSGAPAPANLTALTGASFTAIQVK